jgi:hypothetical protein
VVRLFSYLCLWSHQNNSWPGPKSLTSVPSVCSKRLLGLPKPVEKAELSPQNFSAARKRKPNSRSGHWCSELQVTMNSINSTATDETLLLYEVLCFLQSYQGSNSFRSFFRQICIWLLPNTMFSDVAVWQRDIVLAFLQYLILYERHALNN